jgi:hypothetical protein
MGYDEQLSTNMKEQLETRPCPGEEALYTENGTKLLWPGVARDSSVGLCKRTPSPPASSTRPVVARASGGSHDRWNLLNWSLNSTATFNQIRTHRFCFSLEHSLLNRLDARSWRTHTASEGNHG